MYSRFLYSCWHESLRTDHHISSMNNATLIFLFNIFSKERNGKVTGITLTVPVMWEGGAPAVKRSNIGSGFLWSLQCTIINSPQSQAGPLCKFIAMMIRRRFMHFYSWGPTVKMPGWAEHHNRLERKLCMWEPCVQFFTPHDSLGIIRSNS